MNIPESFRKSAIGLIPSRMSSSRLPGKPLLDVAGKPLLQRVWEGACQSKFLGRVIIAAADSEIAELCMKMGAEYIMTPHELPSGTDRIIHAYKIIGGKFDIIVNIQGDEPLINGSEIDELLLHFLKSGNSVGTLIKKIETAGELFNESNVKVVLKPDNTALYFSRNVIPFLRGIEPENYLARFTFWKHIGIYAYTHESLMKFYSLSPSKLELAEKLEQLRLLESGSSYFCLETIREFIGVDTPEDLERARRYFRSS